MQNQPPPRRPHPLEVPPTPPPQPPANARRVMLHLLTVKPRVTYSLIALNILVFAVRAISPVWDDKLFTLGASNHDLVLRFGETYRLFSAMFLHMGIYDARGALELRGITHLVFNMYALYAVGTSVEQFFGHTRFLVIYLLGGLAGSILSALLNPVFIYSVGASGAIFAIIGAELVYLYYQRHLFGEFGKIRRKNLIFIAAINLVAGFMADASGGTQIDNFGHLGGFIGGLLLAWFISPQLNLVPHPEKANEILAQDTNPLRQKYWVISLYLVVMIVLVFIGTLGARGAGS